VESPGERIKADALISNKSNLFLGVQTADCFPIFLFDPQNRAIGVIHAGWQGAIKGIIPKTISMMKTEFSSNPLEIRVAVGPGLQKECFEVQEDVYDQFPGSCLIKHPDAAKRYLDLQKYVIDNLITSGIQPQNIELNKSCTKCLDSLYYSFRRDGEKSGRMMGLLGIRF
jgi:YfiH family protein